MSDEYNPLDNDALEQKKKDEERRRLELQANDFRKILGMPEGRRFVWRYLSETGVFHGSFDGTSRTFFNEGRRDIGLKLLNEVIATRPDAFTQMQQEHASAAKKREE